ncbi:hypothetical protein RUM4293_04255 [Ruegeria atlantica]|uniref:Uncharacterized protein n=1 Tax=Ruegeria atlantica TaxID=81569 RepID=A0A0P1EPB0_9RHOB|nr:hypothetical protein RUM4293_04255 [Ruegeria atlantica]
MSNTAIRSYGSTNISDISSDTVVMKSVFSDFIAPLFQGFRGPAKTCVGDYQTSGSKGCSDQSVF